MCTFCKCCCRCCCCHINLWMCVCFTYMQSVNGTTMYGCTDMFVCPYRFCLYFIQRCCCCLYAWQNIKFHVYSTKHLCILQQPHLPSALRNKYTTNVNDGDQKEHSPIPIYTQNHTDINLHVCILFKSNNNTTLCP